LEATIGCKSDPPARTTRTALNNSSRGAPCVVVFDPRLGLQAHATIVGDRLPRVVVEVEEPRPGLTDNMPVTLLQALGKGDKPEQAVRDATAFGALELVFVETERTVSRGDRGERLERIAAQVARQCGRGDLPRISGPLNFDESLAVGPMSEGTLRLVCGFSSESQPLLSLLRDSEFPTIPVVVLIGPEGGLSDEELARARAAGFSIVSLGPYVLRMETACSAVLATLRAAASG
jgi:16S rRNA (uracil1498-N3)-methyltransferase